ncbi:hypothetical protein GX408_12805, partial [bacterium]|nr:hypothetical protein [bacterium]
MKRMVFGLCLLFVACGNQEQDQDSIVALAEGRPIRASTFSRAMMDRLRFSAVDVQDTPELRRQVIHDIACRYRCAEKALQAGLQRRPEFRRAMAAESTVVILHGLWQQEIGRTASPETIPEEQVQDAFRKMSMKWHVRHLYADRKSVIDSLYARLRSGDSFDAVARRCMKDTTRRANAADLGVLSWGDLDDLRLEEAVFELSVGRYSKPVESKYGWHILYLHNLTYRPLLTEQEYLVKRPSIREQLWRRRLNQQSDERIQALMQSKNIRMNVPLIIELEKAQRRLKNNGLISFQDITQVADVPLQTLLQQRQNARLAVYDGGEWTVADFSRYLNTVSPEILQRSLYRAVAVSLRNYFLLNIADEKGIDRLPMVRREIDDKRRHLLSASYLAAYADSCTMDETDERRYYQEHLHQFLADREMSVYEILLASEKEAYRLRSTITNEKEFRDLARLHTVRPGFREREGYLGFLKKADFGEISMAAFQMKPGAARGPVIKTSDGYSLIMVADSRDLYFPFEQVRKTIQQTLQQQKKAWAWQKLLREVSLDDRVVFKPAL